MRCFKTTATLVIVLVLLFGVATWSGRNRFDISNNFTEPAAASHGVQTNSVSALREAIARLEAEHIRLEQSLASINAETAQLEKAKGQTGHAVQLYRELTAQANAQSQDPTNSYSTPRHVVVGIGKQARLLAEAQSKWGDLDSPDPEKQSDDEKKAMEQAMLVLVSEQFRLQRAVEDLKANGWEAAFDEASCEALADYVTCYLYGALKLLPGQFYRANDLLQQYYKQAEQKELLLDDPDETIYAGDKFKLPLSRETFTPDPDPSAASERATALKQINENARGQIESLLSAEQKGLFNNSTFRDLRLVGGTFHPPGTLNGAVAHFGAQAPVGTEPRP